MRRQVVGALLLGSFAIWYPTPVTANPLSDSCGLVSALTSGADRGLEQIITITSHWPDDQREQLRTLIGPMFRAQKYAGGDVYLIADFGENAVEHLIIMRSDKVGVHYFRLLYERGQNGLLLINIDAQPIFKNVMTPFAQKPERLMCK